MFRFLALAPLLFAISIAQAQPVKTEFVTGSGLIFSNVLFVDFALDASQLDPDEPVGSMVAEFDAFPQHLVMTFESTRLTSIAVDKRTALVTGTAWVVDLRTGFDDEIPFNAVFEDVGRKRHQNDSMSLTLFFPTVTETYSGQIALGDVEVGKRRP